ncbi:hypothetical protein BH11ARM1_BH11ARM1_07820 [soil metagenome]
MQTDPNKDRDDSMVAEYWTLGEDFQDAVVNSGYEHPQVDGIAVDIHDLLQACDAIRESLASDIPFEEKVAILKFELNHMSWHCEQATAYLTASGI